MTKARDLANFVSTGNPLADGTLTVADISDLTASAAELNTLDGITATTADHQVLRRSGASVGFGAVNLASSNAVTGDLPFSNLAQGSALSVLGVTGNATADVASIAAGTDHQVLRRSGTSVAFGAVALNQSAAVTGTLSVGNGGTGGTTFTANNVLLGNGTSAFQTVAPGTNGNILTSNGTTWTSAAPTGGANYQEFTSSGTYTKPAGATFVLVEAWGAGGGGASGGRGTLTAGTGGGGGAYNFRVFAASQVGSTETVTIGAGGTAGAAQTVNSTNPNNGGNGGDSTFGSLLTGFGGQGGTDSNTGVGQGAGTLSGTISNAGGFPRSSGGSGGDGHFGGTSQRTSGGSSSGFGGGSGGNSITFVAGGCSSHGGPGGGGGGGGGPSGDSQPTAGGSITSNAGGGGAAGVNATTSTGNGTAGTAGTGRQGGGGGGRGGSTSGTGGAGGAGGQPAGGGGAGGNSTNGSNSGAGGVGGAGLIRVYTW